MKKALKVILGFNAVSLIHLVRFKPAEFVGACSKAFTSAHCWSSKTDLSTIPTISIDEIVGDRKPLIKLPVVRYEEGMLPSNEALALLASLVAEAPHEVLEIGTFMGHTTRIMAENLEHGVIHTVDLPLDYTGQTDAQNTLPQDDFHLIERRVVGREFLGKACSSRIKQHFGDSATWDFREAGTPTFFFIDGAHTYEYCKKDSENCFDVCSGKGVFFWHDVNDLHPGVVRFIHHWRSLGRDLRRVYGTDLAYWKSA